MRIKGHFAAKCKIQGFLTRAKAKEIADGPETFCRVDEVTFLGTQVSLRTGGVHVSHVSRLAIGSGWFLSSMGQEWFTVEVPRVCRSLTLQP